MSSRMATALRVIDRCANHDVTCDEDTVDALIDMIVDAELSAHEDQAMSDYARTFNDLSNAIRYSGKGFVRDLIQRRCSNY